MTWVRKDVGGVTAWTDELTWYAKGVAAMQALDADDPLGWRYQAAIHGISPLPSPAPGPWSTCQHSTWFFLPWHRMYLMWFERIVRHHVVAAGGPDTWALPYWGYGAAGGRRLPKPFRDDKLPSGAANPLYVPQRRTSVLSGQPLGAQVVDASEALTKWWFTSNFFVRGFGGGETGFHHGGGSEAGQLELQPHNIVHVVVGGSGGLMTNPNTAALDPIFWLHHANIDRLWEVWRRANYPDKDPYPTGVKFRGQQFDFRDDHGAAVTTAVSAVLDFAALDYTYESFAPTTAPGADIQAVPPVSAGPGDAGATPAMVGRAEDSMVVTAQGGEVTVPLGPSPPGLDDSDPPPHWLLELGDVTGSENPGVVYGVHVYPPGDDADRDAHRVGLVSFFGIELVEDGHPLRYTFDVTETLTRLRAAGTGPEEVEVALWPFPVVDESGPAGAGDATAPADDAGAAGGDPITITIGTVAVHVAS